MGASIMAHVIRAAALAGVRRAPAPLRRNMASMSPQEELSMQKLYPGFRDSWFGSPGQKGTGTWKDTQERWIIVEAYPLFAAIGLGCGICLAHCLRHLFFSPDVFLTKKNRNNAMIDNQQEGEAWKGNPLRKMAALKSNKEDPMR